MAKKFCDKCGQLHDKYEVCPNVEPPKYKGKPSKSYSDMQEDELRLARFYNSKAWRSKRKDILEQAKGLCELCIIDKHIANATSVHHIVKLVYDYNKRLDDNNLIALCDCCHRTVEALEFKSLNEFNVYINELINNNKNK